MHLSYECQWLVTSLYILTSLHRTNRMSWLMNLRW